MRTMASIHDAVTNETSQETTFENENLFSSSELRIIYTCYGGAIVAGLIVNFLAMFPILKYRHMRTTVNLLILNLSVSDAVAVVSVIPYVYVDMYKAGVRGNLANILCGIEDGLSLFFVASLASLLTLSVLSISRYLVISHPLKFSWHLNKRNISWVILLVWAVSGSLLLPSFLSYNYDVNRRLCLRKWAGWIDPVVYFVATAVVGLLVPLSTLTFTYICSAHALYYENSQLKSLRTQSMRQRRQLRSAQKKRALSLLGAMILVYVICWLPFGVYWLLSVPLQHFSTDSNGQMRALRAAKMTVFIAMCSAVVDPALYAFSNRYHRHALKMAIRGRSMNAVSSIPMPTIER